MLGAITRRKSIPAPGFSLVEVVVVVTLIGMAAAFAVPRFTDLANRTRASEVLALNAHVRAAAQMAHAEYVASEATLSAATFQGKTVTLKNGFPDASGDGIGNAPVDWGGFVLKTGPTEMIFSKIGSPADSRCSVTYRAASELAMSEVITDVNVTGC